MVVSNNVTISSIACDYCFITINCVFAYSVGNLLTLILVAIQVIEACGPVISSVQGYSLSCCLAVC